MRHLNWYITTIVLAWVGLIGLASSARAAPQATYTLVQSHIGPSGNGSAGLYTIASSIGQPTAGEVSAGIYTFGNGFWGGGAIVAVVSTYQIYLPLVWR